MKRRNLLIGLLTFMFATGVFNLFTPVAYGQSALGLNWTSLGPDNYSGRTRALLLSNKDPQSKTLFAGGVSGGLWKSVTGGLTWTQINTNNVVLNVSSIAQAPNGDIYVGTGENFASERFNLFSGFIGQGIYKSTDGNSFTKLSSTNPGSFNNPDAEWAFINKIAAAENNKVYTATNSGLKVSVDGGETWSVAKAGGVDLTEPAKEVVVATDGSVVASVGNKVYLSANGAADAFVMISATEGENFLPHDGVGRVLLAFAPSDASTLYAVMISDGSGGLTLRGQLLGVYVSKDKGQSWRLVGPGASSVFNVFGNFANTTHYGDYAASIVVSHTNPDEVLIGGMYIWAGNKVLETGFYEWQLRGVGASNLFHSLVLDPNTQGLGYASSDQGVFRTQNNFLSLDGLNRGYRTSMFYTVAFDDKGRVVGGTQGNGILFIDGEGNTSTTAVQVYGGFVGGSVEMSMIYPEALFYSSTNGTLARSADLGVSLTSDFVPTTISNSNSSVFLTPFRMWESFNNINSRDSLTYIAKADLTSGQTIEVNSKTARYPFNYTMTQNLTKGDSIKIKDIISSRFFLGVANGIYMTKEALDFGIEPEWFKIANVVGIPTCMAYSDDANYLFVGTKEGKVYRIANIAAANTFEKADVSSTAIIISTTLIKDFPGRYVTSVAVDQKNELNVLVTLGDYGSDEFVYFTNNSLDQTPTFNSVQGNLPKMPVYASLFEFNTSNVLLGTDFGIYTTKSLGANTTWTPENNGMGALPIMSIRQQTAIRPVTATMPGISNSGAIYIASHGNGIFENRLYVGLNRPIAKPAVDDMLTVYPNPVINKINFTIDATSTSNVVFKVYDLRGNTVMNMDLGALSKGVNRISVNADNLSSGTYIMQVVNGTQVQKAKFVVVK